MHLEGRGVTEALKKQRHLEYKKRKKSKIFHCSKNRNQNFCFLVNLS